MDNATVAVTIPTMGATHLVDTLASLPPGLPLYLRDNREENWGVAKSWNWGIREALKDGAQYVLVLNDDVRLAPGFIERLVEDLQRDNVILASGRPDHVEVSPPTRRLAMSAFLCDHRLFDEIGEFDESFWPAYFEDDDMLQRIRNTNRWKTWFDSDAVFHHWVSSTLSQFRDIRRMNRRYFKENRERFFQKWGFYPDGK
ncbi:glycosyltransferase family 2 protein [Sulfobacillus thermosulfidooxidans]|uniref:glycosyltransferase family 2 protein n=1 Tax=Sulfobacillus thermosulfidooxidans TaxID=28034 RepID=UPI0006B41192|nr:glycosyltransferase [Sulfobacillus thermosulfidooxidans]